jgi:hypothetical protein
MEFHISGEKRYLSTVSDMYNREIADIGEIKRPESGRIPNAGRKA